MPLKITNLNEFIRIKRNRIAIKTKVFGGMQGDYFVLVSPSLNVSGYGKGEKEARASFKENLELFCSDLSSLSLSEIDNQLRRMGYKKEVYHNKNYSKSFVDETGVLKVFDGETARESMFEWEL